MYYYISIIITILIFILIQLNEYKNSKLKHKRYTLFNLTNFFLLFFIYILSTIILFLICENKDYTNVIKNPVINKKIEIDKNLLRKIPDSIYTGFTPYAEE